MSTTNAEIARRILGSDYEGFSRFFAELFSYCFELEDSDSKQFFLIAFLTRRCHVLLEIFLDIFEYYADENCPVPPPPYLQEINLSGIQEIVETRFITDSNLITQAGRIAEYYQEFREFPKIIILDEIILHGRAVNNLLLGLESGILRRLEQLDPDFDTLDRSIAIARLSHAIDLQIYAQNDEPLLLLDRYSRRLYVKRLCNQIEIRKLSNRFATLVANAGVNNVAFSWNFKISDFAAQKWEAFLPAPEFVAVKTRLKSISQTCHIWLYPNTSEPKVICTVRQKHSSNASNDVLVVPFLITDRFPRKNLYQLHKRICEDFNSLNLSFLTSYNEPDIGAADSCHLRWLSETNDLILSYLMFRRFCGEDGSHAQWKDYLETAILARNYKFISPSGPGHEKITTELKSIWLWDPPCPDLLEQYFDILLDGAQPLWSAAEFDGSFQGMRRIDGNSLNEKRLIIAVEDAIASIGYEAEQNACEKYSSGVFLSDETLSDWGKKYSLSEILMHCKRNWEGSFGSSMDVYSALALIIQEMDLGIIGINPQYEHSTETVYSTVRAGEHSLFIKPTRYRDFIPVLIEIYKRCRDCQLDLDLEIKRFIKRMLVSIPNLETTAAELCEFMRDLKKTNQKIEDWNLLLPDYGNSEKFDVHSMTWQIRYLQEYGKI